MEVVFRRFSHPYINEPPEEIEKALEDSSRDEHLTDWLTIFDKPCLKRATVVEVPQEDRSQPVTIWSFNKDTQTTVLRGIVQSNRPYLIGNHFIAANGEDISIFEGAVIVKKTEKPVISSRFLNIMKSVLLFVNKPIN